MGLKDKTRKALWARSGNRCSLCRIELVQESTESNDSIIIGEECHIISAKLSGPRGGHNNIEDFDHYDNLILLCANDHKRIDELTDIYSEEKLKLIKTQHESWVKSTLEKDVIAFTNEKNNIKSLPKIVSGKQIVDLINGSHMFHFNHDDLETEEEASLIGDFFEELRDYSDIISEIPISDIVRLGVRYNAEIEKIKQMGFLLFGLNRKIRLRNDKHEDMGLYNTTSLIAVRQDNPCIIGDFLIAKFNISKVSFG